MAGFLEYVPGESLLHRMNPVAKLACALILSVACFCTGNLVFLLGIVVLDLALAASCSMTRQALGLARAVAAFSAVLALIALLIFIALVFINNTIRLAILARRKEIAIMRLVGASNGFIRGPFLMEGALHALIGSLLAVGVLQALRSAAIPRVQAALPFLSLEVDGGTYAVIYLSLVGAGLVIGLVGSAFAMRRYLKV